MNDATNDQNSITFQGAYSITFNYLLIFKTYKMRKSIFIGILMLLTLSSTIAVAGTSDLKSTTENTAALVKTENKLSAEEIASLTKRVEEIRTMDKSEMTSLEKRELRKELKGIKENVHKSGEVIYISGGTLLLIILIIVLI